MRELFAQASPSNILGGALCSAGKSFKHPPEGCRGRGGCLLSNSDNHINHMKPYSGEIAATNEEEKTDRQEAGRQQGQLWKQEVFLDILVKCTFSLKGVFVQSF